LESFHTIEPASTAGIRSNVARSLRSHGWRRAHEAHLEAARQVEATAKGSDDQAKALLMAAGAAKRLRTVLESSSHTTDDGSIIASREAVPPHLLLGVTLDSLRSCSQKVGVKRKMIGYASLALIWALMESKDPAMQDARIGVDGKASVCEWSCHKCTEAWVATAAWSVPRAQSELIEEATRGALPTS